VLSPDIERLAAAIADDTWASSLMVNS